MKKWRFPEYSALVALILAVVWIYYLYSQNHPQLEFWA